MPLEAQPIHLYSIVCIVNEKGVLHVTSSQIVQSISLSTQTQKHTHRHGPFKQAKRIHHFTYSHIPSAIISLHFRLHWCWCMGALFSYGKFVDWIGTRTRTFALNVTEAQSFQHLIHSEYKFCCCYFCNNNTRMLNSISAREYASFSRNYSFSSIFALYTYTSLLKKASNATAESKGVK